MRQDGKVVIITGASSGFGYLTALDAAKRGYRVVVTARRAERLRELVKQIEDGGGTALAVPGDVTDADDQQRLIAATLERFGRIDVLLNNAGVPLPYSFTEAPLDELRRQWHTNTTSVIELTKRALPALLETKGIVVNVSSGASRFSFPGFGLYAPTKVAVSSVTDALRRELGPQGVSVCLVEPGPFRTEFSDQAGRPQDRQRSLDPAQVVTAVVRLFERPKRLTVVPGWMRPLFAIMGGLSRLLPGVVDLIFWLVAKRQQGKAQQSAA